MIGLDLLLGLLGILIGVSLGSVGAGGSILAVPILVFVAGEAPKSATVSSLVIVGATALIALGPHLKAHRVRGDIAIPFGVIGIAGSFVGKKLSDTQNPNVLLLLFSVVMVAAAALMERRNRSPVAATAQTGGRAGQPGTSGLARVATLANFANVANLAGEPVLASAAGKSTPNASYTAKVALIGAGVGVMTGFFGVGGGFVIVPALTLLLGISMHEAVGTSLLIVVMNSVTTFALKSRGVAIDWTVIAIFTGAAAVGALGGSEVARRFDGHVLTKWFVRMVLAIAAYTAIKAILALVN